MIVEHLLDRDVSSDAAGAEGDVTSAAARLAAMAGNGSGNDGVALGGGVSEDKSRSMPGVTGRQSPPRRSDETGGGGVAENGHVGGAWKVYQPAAYGAAVDDFIAGCGGVGVSVGVVRRSWRDRFVSSGGIDTLVELLLTRDWDPARRGVGVRGEEGESTAGISLACLALLLGLMERFLEEKYLPEPRQLGRLVRGQGLARVAFSARPPPAVSCVSDVPRFGAFLRPVFLSSRLIITSSQVVVNIKSLSFRGKRSNHSNRSNSFLVCPRSIAAPRCVVFTRKRPGLTAPNVPHARPTSTPTRRWSACP